MNTITATANADSQELPGRSLLYKTASGLAFLAAIWVAYVSIGTVIDGFALLPIAFAGIAVALAYAGREFWKSARGT